MRTQYVYYTPQRLKDKVGCSSAKLNDCPWIPEQCQIARWATSSRIFWKWLTLQGMRTGFTCGSSWRGVKIKPSTTLSMLNCLFCFLWKIFVTVPLSIYYCFGAPWLDTTKWKTPVHLPQSCIQLIFFFSVFSSTQFSLRCLYIYSKNLLIACSVGCLSL